MYARKENNEVVRYNKLPKEIRIEATDDWVDITEANRVQYGFKDVVQPTYNSRTQKRTTNLIEEGDHYTYEVVSLNKDLAQLKKELLLELKGYRKSAHDEGKQMDDYYKDVGRNNERQALQAKVAELYQLHETIRAQIEALTTIDDAANYTLPMDDINKGLKYLRDLI